MVGLSLALALGQSGFHICIIEAQNFSEMEQSDETPCDLRVVALAKGAVQFYQQLGIWQSIQGFRVGRMDNMRVWDQNFSGRVDFSAEEALEQNLGYIVEQKNIMQALHAALNTLPNVHCQVNTHLQQVQKEATQLHCTTTHSERLSAKLLVGCDGGNSWVRTISDIQTKIVPYQQKAIVATIESDKPHNHTAYQRFNQTGALALLPLYKDNLLSIVWSTHEDWVPGLLALPEKAFETKLTQEIDCVLDRLSLKSQRVAFPLKQLHAKSYVADRVVLLGDAAHIFHPLAGQGVNFGLKDAQALVKILQKAKQKSRDIGLSYLLRRYERERRYHNQLMIYLMRAFKEGFGTQHTATTFIRNEALDWVNNSNICKNFFIQHALG